MSSSSERRSTFRCAAALTVLALACFMSGCLRHRLATQDEGFRDAPGMPQQDFGRPAERLGQMGLDPRSRQIESSLGIE